MFWAEIKIIYLSILSIYLRDDIIHQFLGPEICNSDLVRNSKLKQDEKDWLDRPLS
jgi:SET domain-containing protein